MQIVSLGVFNETGRRRDVKFRLGSLNILTGKSKTGKSAILDIVEYCLGRRKVTIPTGVISDHTSWYYVIVQFANERVLICRPKPEGASTNRAMVRSGGLELTAPMFDELKVNADTKVVKKMLTERLGIDLFSVEPEDASLRQSFDISVRQALFYCFQNQGEIASRDVLFHRQAENEVKVAIRDTLPYFLGAATPEQSKLRHQLVSVRRALERTQNRIRVAEADAGQQDGRVAHLIESAVSLEVLRTDARSSAEKNPHMLLEEILGYRIDSFYSQESDAGRRRRKLATNGQEIQSQINEVDYQLELLEKLQDEQSYVRSEDRYQVDRLRALDLLVPKSMPTNGDVRVCPLCDQGLDCPDETVDELRLLLKDLEVRLETSKGRSSRRQVAIEHLKERRESLVEELRNNVVELDVIAQQEEEIAKGRGRREQIVFLQGRVAQELERTVDTDAVFAELRNAERRYREQLTRLEYMNERDDPSVALRSAIDSVSDLMTDYARYLQLEGSEYYVRLEPSQLAVVVQRPGGRVPLRRMGSAENWVGYHLVAHLALHSWFATNDRPVPRFVMFDQPTQAFFPEEVVDAAEDENADWAAVRRQFALMREVVNSLAGGLQIIVCDHANLADKWFQEAVVENWRGGVALIPTDWLEEELE